MKIAFERIMIFLTGLWLGAVGTVMIQKNILHLF